MRRCCRSRSSLLFSSRPLTLDVVSLSNGENILRKLSLYEKQRLAEVTAVKQRLADNLRGVAKGVIKPVPERDAMKASF